MYVLWSLVYKLPIEEIPWFLFSSVQFGVVCNFLVPPVNVGFPGGSVVKSLPANAGDTGSIPDPGRSHVLGGNICPYATTTEATCPPSEACAL